VRSYTVDSQPPNDLLHAEKDAKGSRRHTHCNTRVTLRRYSVAQPSLSNRSTLVHADVKISLMQNAAKHSIPAVRDLLAGFCHFYLPFSHLTPSTKAIPASYRVRIWYGNTRMAGLQSGEGRMVINSVVAIATLTHRVGQEKLSKQNGWPK